MHARGVDNPSHLRLTEFGVLPGDDDVAKHRKLTAPSESESVDRGHLELIVARAQAGHGRRASKRINEAAAATVTGIHSPFAVPQGAPLDGRRVRLRAPCAEGTRQYQNNDLPPRARTRGFEQCRFIRSSSDSSRSWSRMAA